MKALLTSNEPESALRMAIDTALEEQKSGEFISLESVTEWLRSWGTVKETPPPEADIFKKFD